MTPYRNMAVNEPVQVRARRPWWRRLVCRLGFHKPQPYTEGAPAPGSPIQLVLVNADGAEEIGRTPSRASYYQCACGAFFVIEWIPHDTHWPRFVRCRPPSPCTVCGAGIAERCDAGLHS